jgi:hypothetical protein
MPDDDPILKQPASKRANRKLWMVTAVTGALLLLIAAGAWVILHIR